jgi:carbon monoxide dehydrogenase subunit G
MKIESQRVQIPASPEAVFAFASNLNNFDKLLPMDRISEWESTHSYCSFKIQGTATIDMQVAELNGPGTLLLTSGTRSPFSFTVRVDIQPTASGSDAGLVMDADVNPFLKMMVEKPLSNLFNFMANKLIAEFTA